MLDFLRHLFGMCGEHHFNVFHIFGHISLFSSVLFIIKNKIILLKEIIVQWI